MGIFKNKAKSIKAVIPSIFLWLTSTFLYSQDIAMVNKTAAYLRDNPNGKKIMQLPYGTKIKIINVENSWYEVEINVDAFQGFIHESVISLETLVKNNYDREKMLALELSDGGFEDAHITLQDDAPDAFYTKDLYRKLNEGLERVLFWEYKEPSTRYFIYNMDVLVERTKGNTYSNTPCEIFNQSKIYHVFNEIYNNEPVTKPTYREFEKPQIKKSFFSFKPENYLISNMTEKQDTLFLDFAIPKLIHLLRIYFKEENSFRLYKHNGTYTYTSSQRISFFSTDENGNNRIENTGEIIYFPGQHSKLCISNLETPYNSNMKYLYFSNEDMISRHLENKISITPTTKTINGWFTFDVFEFDFNSDGVVDLLRSFEDCPEEAGDSSDEVYYFNVNGAWKSMLARRLWCNP